MIKILPHFLIERKRFLIAVLGTFLFNYSLCICCEPIEVYFQDSFLIQTNNRIITGRVVDYDANPLKDVRISIENSTNFILSDIEGKFRIETQGNTDVLVFTYPKYKTLEVASEKISSLTVILEEEESNRNSKVVSSTPNLKYSGDFDHTLSNSGERRSRTIKGRVVDHDSEPLSEVLVAVKNSASAFTTLEDGGFEIEIFEENFILSFSLDGYQSLELDMSRINTLTVILEKNGSSIGSKLVSSTPYFTDRAVSSKKVVDQQRGGGETGKTLANSGEGRYFGLFIGINEYADERIKDLNFPISDAKKIKDVLSKHYTFDSANIQILVNPNRARILDELEKVKEKVNEKDYLLIFYAGHGSFIEKLQRSYWWPSDADKVNKTNWIASSTICDYIKEINCKHTLLISDACFSGGIFVGRNDEIKSSKSLAELDKIKSRRAITSGTKYEPVPDYSIFLGYLLSTLQRNDVILLDSQSLFSKLRISVMHNSNNTPLDGYLPNTGDEGGDFIFKRK